MRSALSRPAATSRPDRAGGVGELGATAVVDAHRQREHVVVAGQLLGDLQLLDHRAPQPWGAARPAHAYAELVHLVATAPDHVAVEAHQELHLVGGARPVLGGEGVRRDRLHADLDRPLDHVEERVLALLVAGRARQPALLGPATVAVHDDRDVARAPGRPARPEEWPRRGAGRVGAHLARLAGPAHRSALADVGQGSQAALEVPGDVRRDQAARLAPVCAARRRRPPPSRRPAAHRAAASVSRAGLAEPGTRQPAHSVPPAAGLNARCGPSSPQLAQAENEGA